MPRKGWTKLEGTSERYLSPTGEVTSRRQYDNLRASELGWENRSKYERRFEDQTYLWAYRRLQRERGVSVSKARQLDRMGGPMSTELRKAQATGWGKTPEGRSPDGPMSQLLIDMGMRDPSATYAVGETDKVPR